MRRAGQERGDYSADSRINPAKEECLVEWDGRNRRFESCNRGFFGRSTDASKPLKGENR